MRKRKASAGQIKIKKDFSASGAKKKLDEEISLNKNHGQNQRNRFTAENRGERKRLSRLPAFPRAAFRRRARCRSRVYRRDDGRAFDRQVNKLKGDLQMIEQMNFFQTIFTFKNPSAGSLSREQVKLAFSLK